jgi:hypothetical protein
MPPRIPPDQVSPAMNDLPNFDPIAVADEIAALESEAQDKLAEAKDEFKSRSEKIAAILWEVKQHHPEHLDAICERAKIGRGGMNCCESAADARRPSNLARNPRSARLRAERPKRLGPRLSP